MVTFPGSVICDHRFDPVGQLHILAVCLARGVGEHRVSIAWNDVVVKVVDRIQIAQQLVKGSLKLIAIGIQHPKECANDRVSLCRQERHFAALLDHRRVVVFDDVEDVCFTTGGASWRHDRLPGCRPLLPSRPYRRHWRTRVIDQVDANLVAKVELHETPVDRRTKSTST